jgi:hypothetical protein
MGEPHWEVYDVDLNSFEYRSDAIKAAKALGGRVVRRLSNAEAKLKMRATCLRQYATTVRSMAGPLTTKNDADVLKHVADCMNRDADKLWPVKP